MAYRDNPREVYARYEPTDDPLLLAEKKAKPHLRLVAPKHCDVQVYRDREATERSVRFRWHDSNKPSRRRSRIHIGGVGYRLIWLPAMQNAPTKRK